MINVQLGSKQEEKPVKPFPKMMVDRGGDVVYFIRSGYGLPVYKLDHFIDTDEINVSNWAMEDFTDYNEPVTLQNA